jgi:hypothetical protein
MVSKVKRAHPGRDRMIPVADSLRDAIINAKDGDTIVFDPSLAGQTITLTSDQLDIKKSLDIEGLRNINGDLDPSLLAISGNDTNRVFAIDEGFTVTIAGLTITRGRGQAKWQGGGGGIQNKGSILTLKNDVFSGNQALGNFVSGGAVSNLHGGILTVIDSTFDSNVVTGSNGGLGGAISNGESASIASVTRSKFVGNHAEGSNGGRLNAGHTDLGFGEGGAIVNQEGATLTVEDSTFTGNLAIGGNEGDPGNGPDFSFVGVAYGGAISNHDTSVLTLRPVYYQHLCCSL